MIRFQDLHKGFGPKQVLQGFSLEVPDGETTVVIGYSGTGKSVALKHVVGLLEPDAPLPTFRFISKGQNPYLPSQPRPVQIVLRGNWRLLAPEENVTVKSTSNQTALRFDGRRGMSVQAELVRK